MWLSKLKELFKKYGPTILPILIDLFKPAAGSPNPGFAPGAALSAEAEDFVAEAVAAGGDEDQARELAFYAQHAA